MVIPTDVRQFRLKHMFWLALSFCLPLRLRSYSPFFGVLLLMAVSCFWAGMGSLVVSDIIDNGPIDERGWTSQFFNLIGFSIVALSMITIILLLTATVLLILSNVVFSIAFDTQP